MEKLCFYYYQVVSVDGIHHRENVVEALEKINTFIATRTTITRNTFTVADIALWAAIKGMIVSISSFSYGSGYS